MMGLYATAHVWRSEANPQNLGLSFHHISPRNWTQVIPEPDGKCLYPLSYPARPKICFLILIYFMCMFALMYTCISHVCLVPMEARRVSWISWNQSLTKLWTSLWVLSTKIGSSTEQQNTLNHQAQSPALLCLTFGGKTIKLFSTEATFLASHNQLEKSLVFP